MYCTISEIYPIVAKITNVTNLPLAGNNTWATFSRGDIWSGTLVWWDVSGECECVKIPTAGCNALLNVGDEPKGGGITEVKGFGLCLGFTLVPSTIVDGW